VRYNGAVTDARSTLRVDEIQRAHPQECLLAVAGELDLATIGVLKDAVSGRLAADVDMVLDLAELTFCDSTGLGAFVALFREAGTRGARFALASPRKRIGDLLTLSGIDQVIAVFESPVAAFAATEAATEAPAEDAG
jgi:anti-sigma B factor antagonist